MVAGTRKSAALTYLAAARGRSNLTIRDKALVDCVLLKNRRVEGVRLADSGEVIHADRVLLAAGAYGSPIILMRSGIGPTDHLGSLNIPVIHNLQGVGQNLSDHPKLELRFAAPTPERADEGTGCQGLRTLRSPETVTGYDLHIFSWTISSTDSIFSIFAGVMKPYSRGSVRLRSNDPNAAPITDTRLCQPSPRPTPTCQRLCWQSAARHGCWKIAEEQVRLTSACTRLCSAGAPQSE